MRPSEDRTAEADARRDARVSALQAETTGMGRALEDEDGAEGEGSREGEKSGGADKGEERCGEPGAVSLQFGRRAGRGG